MPKIDIKYLKICPIDKETASFEEIINYGECQRDFLLFKKPFQELIKGVDCQELKEAKIFCETENKLREFVSFFQKISGMPPFSLQIYWAKRFLVKESFSIIAPTGFGKTTFGIIFSLFLKKAMGYKKIYYIVPTKILLNEISNKFNEYNRKVDAKILSILKPSDKEKLKDDFDILITTAQFLHKNFEILPKNFNLVYIDDADSMIRQPKNIDKVLLLLGFSQDEIDKALEIITQKRKRIYDNVANFKESLVLENKGQVIAASATLAPRTKKINLFRELLNFEIGLSSTFLRNIEDFCLLDENFSKNLDFLFDYSKKLIQKFGRGGLIFLDDSFSKEDLNKYVAYLNLNNIRAISYEKFTKKNRELFIKEEIDVVVGFANVRNPLTRGIDLPQAIRYAIFLKIPKFKLPFQINYVPRNLFMLLLTLQKFLNNGDREINLVREMVFLRKYSFMKEEDVLKNKYIKERIEKIQNYLKKYLDDEKFIKKVEEDPEISLLVENGKYFLLIPDARGYIQASGRTSRLYPFGLTKGFSLILAENNKLFTSLKRKLNILGYRINFKDYEEEKEMVTKIFQKIDKDRKIVKKILQGERLEFKDPIKTALIIVESPTKAKTIASFFGKPARRFYKNYPVYEVSTGDYIINITATMGHFVDLVYEKGIYGVEKEAEHFIPVFEPLKICQVCQRHIGIFKNKCDACGSEKFWEKESLIEFLRKLATENQEIYLATDPDTEGEKIAFDLFCYLYPFNQNIKRIELHEITREEFSRQFKNPKSLNISLVQAQLTRRIADRWIGFYLSEKLQKHFKNLNLSAGRVQSPVLGWLISNYEKRKLEKIYLLRIWLENGLNFDFYSEDKELVKKIRKNKDKIKIGIKIVSDSQRKNVKPQPPFQTNDLLKTTWDFLRLDVPTTMNLAQELFERGLITYHRTDSFYVSKTGQEVAKEFLEKFQYKNLYQPRSWGTQGTHECIRPTKPLTVEEIIEQSLLSQQEVLSKNHLKLYRLIFNRFMASQMKEAKIETRLLVVKMLLNGEEVLKIEKEVLNEIIDHGFNTIINSLKPTKIQAGEFGIKEIRFIRFSKLPLYTQATLVEKMKERELGRPSTYATIIQTLFERKYIISNKGYLIPTKHGVLIYDYLIKKYPNLILEDFTKDLEKRMDQIESAKVNYQMVLQDLYDKIFK